MRDLFIRNQSLRHLSIALSVLLVFLLSPRLADAQNPTTAKFEDSFKIGNDTFAIKVVKSFVTLSTGYGEKLEFSVYKNNKFVHSVNVNDGTLIGCRQPFTAPTDVNPIHKLQLASGVRGWWLVTNQTCGNRSTKLYAAILPPLKPEQAYYTSKVLSSNYMGVFARQASNGDGLEAWAYNYCTKCNPSASSATPMYPKYYVLEGAAKMPANPANWPKLSDFSAKLENKSIYPLGFKDLFIAGIANKNTALLKAAKDAYDKPNPEGINNYTAEFLPKTSKDLQEIVQAYEILEKANLLDLGAP